VKETCPVYLDARNEILNIGDLVRYTHEEDTLGIIIAFDPRRGSDPIKVHWQRPLHVEDGVGLNGRSWFVHPENILKKTLDNTKTS